MSDFDRVFRELFRVKMRDAEAPTGHEKSEARAEPL